MNKNFITPSKNSKKVSFNKMVSELIHQEDRKINPSFDENQTIIQNFDTDYTDLEQLKQQRLGHEAFVKIGDIVILKFKNQSSNQQGFIQGDGIVQSQLDLIYVSEKLNGEMEINDVLRKNLKLQQCLFKIKVGKKYQVEGQRKSTKQFKRKRSQKRKKKIQHLMGKYSSNKIYPIDSSEDSDESQDNQQRKQSNDLNKIQANLQEMEEILENNNRTILSYGQEIQFQHLYSGLTLTINRETITQNDAWSIHSNFKITQSDVARKQGDPILYGQQIVI